MTDEGDTDVWRASAYRANLIALPVVGAALAPFGVRYLPGADTGWTWSILVAVGYGCTLLLIMGPIEAAWSRRLRVMSSPVAPPARGQVRRAVVRGPAPVDPLHRDVALQVAAAELQDLRYRVLDLTATVAALGAGVYLVVTAGPIFWLLTALAVVAVAVKAAWRAVLRRRVELLSATQDSS